MTNADFNRKTVKAVSFDAYGFYLCLFDFIQGTKAFGTGLSVAVPNPNAAKSLVLFKRYQSPSR
jgi:hypothetical protein